MGHAADPAVPSAAQLCALSAEARITDSTAVPIEAPVCWRMFSEVVPRATASLRIVCIAPENVGIIVKPMPRPKMNRSMLVAT